MNNPIIQLGNRFLNTIDRFTQPRIVKAVKPTQAPFPDVLVSDWDVGRGKARPQDFLANVNACKGWVYKCVNKIATDLASNHIKLYQVERDNSLTEVANHIFLDNIGLGRKQGKPTPYISYTTLFEGISYFLDLTGNTYLYLLKNRLKIPQEFWYVPSQYMKVVPGHEVLVQGYIYDDGGGEKASFEYEEILHIKYFNPTSVFYGMSPLQGAAHDLSLSDYMEEYADGLYKNRARPDVIVTTPQEMSEPQRKQNLAEWIRMARSKRFGKVAMLSHGASAKPFALTPMELDYLESKKFTREEICSYFSIPPLLMGITSEAHNRSVYDAAERTYKKDCIWPRLKRISQYFNFFVMPLYKSTRPLVVAFDSPVPEDVELQRAEMVARLKNYVTSVNEEREKLGLLPADWGKTPLAPLNMMPLGSASIEPSGSKSVVKSLDEVMEKKKRVHHVLVSKLEADFTKKLEKLFVNWIDRIIKNMDRFKSQKVIKIADEEFYLLAASTMEEELWDMSQTEILRAIESGWLEQVAESGFEMDFSPDYTHVVQRLEQRKIEFKTVADNFYEDVRGVLRQGIEDGKGVPEMSKDIKKWVTDNKKWKAERISATEMGGARNAGEFTFAEQTQVWKEKIWVHALTVKEPRPTHEALNGTVVPFKETFIVDGYEMMYPGDSSYGAGAGSIIWCHCTLIWR